MRQPNKYRVILGYGVRDWSIPHAESGTEYIETTRDDAERRHQQLVDQINEEGYTERDHRWRSTLSSVDRFNDPTTDKNHRKYAEVTTLEYTAYEEKLRSEL